MKSGCMTAGKGWRGEALLTAELRLRSPTADDAAMLARLADDHDIAKWTAELPHPYQISDAVGFIEKAARDKTSGKEITLVIERLRDGELVGAINLSLDGEHGSLGYWIGRAYWNMGYATQAVHRMARLFFQTPGLNCLCAYVMTDNKASARVLEKAGFVARNDISCCTMGGRCKNTPVVLYNIMRDVWNILKTARPLVLVAAAALIDADNRVLLAKRPEGKAMAGLWEFPGGKLNPGESPEKAILRELKEELGINASESCLAPLAFASHDYDVFHLMMPLFVLRQWKGKPKASEGQQLKWVGKDRLTHYPMPPADLPLVPILRDWL